jgi:tetratricopeptide (TPR) repeat protein
MRKAVFPFLVLALAVLAHGQNVPASFNLQSYGVRVEPDKRVMAVLATLEMARSLDPRDSGARLIRTPLSDKGNAFREELDRDNAALPEDLRKKISVFVTSYKSRHSKLNDAELVAPFISMAYALQPAPELGDPNVTSDLPGELLDVLDFAPLVREFYRRSTFAGKLNDYVREYSTDADAAVRPSAREMVSELLDYLHTRPRLIYVERVKTTIKKPGSKQAIEGTTSKEHERHFAIVPEKLAPKGTINFLNIRDDYYVIVPPETDLSVSEARRAFLRFVIDALVLEHSNDADPMREWGKTALDEVRKTNSGVSPDPFLAISRSLVAAVDIRARQRIVEQVALQQAQARIAAFKTDDEKKAYTLSTYEPYAASLNDEAMQQLYDDYLRGAVFVFYFYDELKGLETSGFDIAGSLKEMMAGFDAAKEKDRLASTSAARSRAVAAREERKKHPQSADTVASNPVTANLLQIQKTIEAKDYAKADADLKLLLASYPNEPRIYYNLGRVAGLIAVEMTETDKQTTKLREAQDAYSNVIRYATPNTDRALLSLTYLALGRIYEFASEKDYAIKLYDKAIEIGDVPSGGFKDAIAAKQRLLKPQP